MKREDVKAIFAEATDEQLEKIMALHGSDVEKYKGEAATLKNEAAEKKKAFDLLRGELERLKESNAGAADYKKKFEDLQRDIAEKEKAAAQKQAAEERAAEISRRYNAAAVDKSGKPLKWRHDAIKADYLHKFTEALADDAYKGKSDNEILSELIRDDGGAIEVPGAQTVFSKPYGSGGTITREDFAKMSYKDRVELYKTDRQLYDNLNGGND